jgi:uncharacterized protein YgiM (DUF1202 family)
LTLVALCQLVSAQESTDTDKDRQYVTDQLRLSLYEEPDSQSKVLKLLRSGDLLIIDEIRGPYALVTGTDGTHGWVKRGFLVSNPTSNILLREEQQKSASLFDEIEKLGNSKVVIDTYEKDMDKLMAKIEDLEASNREANETIAKLNQELGVEDESESEAAQAQGGDDSQPGESAAVVLLDTLKTYWAIIAPILIVILLMSFLISKVIIEARIKSRFHGIKIW